MIDPGLEQEAERAHARLIWLVGLAGLLVTTLLVAIAWLVVVPAPEPARPPTAPSPLERGLLDGATGGADARTARERRLERTEWIDRRAGTVRIPLERAIDAAVADPRLIGPRDAAAAVGQ
jgi:hypothetical protein